MMHDPTPFRDPGMSRIARLRLVPVTIGLAAEGEDCCLDAVLQAEFGKDAATWVLTVCSPIARSRAICL